MKFHENPSNMSRVLPCGRTAMTKPAVAVRNVANVHNRNESLKYSNERA